MKEKNERRETLAIKLSKAEHEEVRLKADRMGLTMSAYIRFILFSKFGRGADLDDGKRVQDE